MDTGLAVALFVALGIGGLIGIERERSESEAFAGSRTLPLVGLLGALTQHFFPELLPVAYVLFLLLVVVGYAGKAFVQGDPGMTTAVATILTFLYGAMATHSQEGLTTAVVLGVLTTALLAQKEAIHGYVDRIGRQEMEDALKFLIVSLVVLPLLPDRSMEQLLGLNPRFVWSMVVFVSGISFAAYVLTKALGPRRGIGLTGILGGLVSSTATSMSMAERAKKKPATTGIAGLAIVVASMAMLPRILVEVLVVERDLLIEVGPPVTGMALAGVTVALASFWRQKSEESVEVDLENPFRLKPALLFGAFFALILLISKEGETAFGEAGVYATAVFSGLADVDAITLSLTRHASEGGISAATATTGILLAAVTNTLVKLGIAVYFGSRRLGRTVAPAMLAAVLFGLGWILVV